MTGEEHATCSRTSSGTAPVVLGCGSGRELVGDVHRETVDHADLAVTDHRLVVPHELRLREVRLHQQVAGVRVDQQPAVGLGDVLLVQHAGQGGQGLKSVRAGQRNRGGSGAQVVLARLGARSGALVGRVGGRADARKGRAVAVDHRLVDGDLHLHGRVVGEGLHHVRLGLMNDDVVDLELERLGAVDDQLDGRRGRHGVVQIATDLVVGDGNIRHVVDHNLVAQVGDVALEVGVGDLGQAGRGVELAVELGGPQRRDESTRVVHTGVVTPSGGGGAVVANQRDGSGYSSHVGLLLGFNKGRLVHGSGAHH